MLIFIHDYCRQRSITSHRTVRVPYYSNFTLRGGALGKRINYRNRSEVCKACTKQGTARCIYVREQQKKRNLTARPSVKKKEEGRILIRFRSSDRGKG